MKFWKLLRLLGLIIFLASVLAGMFGIEPGASGRARSDADVRLAPNLVR